MCNQITALLCRIGTDSDMSTEMHCPLDGALLARRLMKFTSSKTGVFSDQRERLLQEEKRNFCIVLSAVSLS